MDPDNRLGVYIADEERIFYQGQRVGIIRRIAIDDEGDEPESFIQEVPGILFLEQELGHTSIQAYVLGTDPENRLGGSAPSMGIEQAGNELNYPGSLYGSWSIGSTSGSSMTRHGYQLMHLNDTASLKDRSDRPQTTGNGAKLLADKANMRFIPINQPKQDIVL
jgi:hypothetical protein